MKKFCSYCRTKLNFRNHFFFNGEHVCKDCLSKLELAEKKFSRENAIKNLGYKNIDEAFSLDPFRAFCDYCYESTTSETAEDTFVINFLFGTKLIGESNICPICGSSVKKKFFWFFFPLVNMGSYRVINLKNGHYLSRRIKDQKISFLQQFFRGQWI